MKVIFLDFDGVMDTSYYNFVVAREGKPHRDAYGLVFGPKCVDYPRSIIERTGANIVVSSTWKWFMTYKDILEMWKVRDLPGIVIGITPTNKDKGRGYEIATWLDECEEECQYVIIDDLGGSNFTDRKIPHLVGR